MRDFPRRVAAYVLLRSLLVQGSWNYETLIGSGFAFAIRPVLRHLHPSDDEAYHAAVDRHVGVFNSHPYFATVAVGAVARLEADGAQWHAWSYDIRTYKSVPDWLNPKFWANPENWDKYRW